MLGYVPEEPALYDYLTAREFLELDIPLPQRGEQIPGRSFPYRPDGIFRLLPGAEDNKLNKGICLDKRVG